jgi:hypothetical protein
MLRFSQGVVGDPESKETDLLSQYFEQEKSNGPLRSLGCVGFSEKECLHALDAVINDLNITRLSFKDCTFTADVKNKISEFIFDRNIAELSIEGCSLESFDILWLNFLFERMFGLRKLRLLGDFTHDDWSILYSTMPVSNLQSLGLRPEFLEQLLSVAERATALCELDLIADQPITFEQVRILFDLINLSHIRKLRMIPFIFESLEARQFFMKKLREDTHIHSLTVKGSPEIEKEFFAVLSSQNSTLDSLVIEPQGFFVFQQRIAVLTARNGFLNQARRFLEGELTDDAEKASVLMTGLGEHSEVGYISAAQEEVQRMIEALKNSQKILPTP